MLLDEAYEIAKNVESDGYQIQLASILSKFFDKRRRSGVSVNKE